MGSRSRRSDVPVEGRDACPGPPVASGIRGRSFPPSGGRKMAIDYGIENERLLELFFAQSMDGFFFMMLDEPVEWGDHVDKDAVLDYVFEHQRMTKVNTAILDQFNASSPDDLLGTTPAQFFS